MRKILEAFPKSLTLGKQAENIWYFKIQKNTKSAKRNSFSPIPRCHYKIKLYHDNFLISYIWFPNAVDNMQGRACVRQSHYASVRLLQTIYLYGHDRFIVHFQRDLVIYQIRILFSTSQLISYISQVILQDKTSASENKVVSQW